MTTTTHVAVLMGGWSSEREGRCALAPPRRCARRRAAIRVTRRRCRPRRPDGAMPRPPSRCLPSTLPRTCTGEDGTIQGVLGDAGNPVTHPGVLASALAMQKELRQGGDGHTGGVPSPRAWWCRAPGGQDRTPLPRPLRHQAVAEGSSVGVFIVARLMRHPPQELSSADWTYGERLWCERSSPAASSPAR